VLAATVYPLGETITRWGMPRVVAVMANLVVTVVGVLLFLGISGYALADNLPRALVDFQMSYAQARSALLEGPSWQQSMARQLPAAEGLEDLIARLQESATVAEQTEATTDAVEQPLGAATDPNTRADGEQGAGAGAEETPLGGTETAASDAAEAEGPSSAETTTRRATGLLRIIVGTTTSLVAWLTQFIVLIFLALYWSLERDTVERLWLSLVPAANRQRVRQTWRRVEEDLGTSVRSELLQAAVAFVLLWLGFRVMGMDYPLLAAWIGALLWLIPLVGWMMAVPLIALVGVLEGPMIALVASLYSLVVFAILGFLIEPRLDVRQRTGSVTGLVVALVLFESLGLLGLVIAAPLAVALHTLVREATAPQLTQTEVQAATAQVATAQAAGTMAPVAIPANAVSLTSGTASDPAIAAATAAARASAPSHAISAPPTAAVEGVPVVAGMPAAAAAATPVGAAPQPHAAAPTLAAAVAGVHALRERLNQAREQVEGSGDQDPSETSERTRSLYNRLQRLLGEAEEALQGRQSS
jgi:predicted PurR-regulated permease PerM